MGLPYTLEYPLEVALRKSPYRPSYSLSFSLSPSAYHYPAIGDARRFAQVAHIVSPLRDPGLAQRTTRER